MIEDTAKIDGVLDQIDQRAIADGLRIRADLLAQGADVPESDRVVSAYLALWLAQRNEIRSALIAACHGDLRPIETLDLYATLRRDGSDGPWLKL
jgi:hypothetical protein